MYYYIIILILLDYLYYNSILNTLFVYFIYYIFSFGPTRGNRHIKQPFSSTKTKIVEMGVSHSFVFLVRLEETCLAM